MIYTCNTPFCKLQNIFVNQPLCHACLNDNVPKPDVIPGERKRYVLRRNQRKHRPLAKDNS